MKSRLIIRAAMAIARCVSFASVPAANSQMVNARFGTGDYTGWIRSGYGDGIVTGD